MANKNIQNDFKTQQIRLGVCYSIYKQAKKKKQATGKEINWDDFEKEKYYIIDE